MSSIFLALLVVWFALAVLLAAWTLFLQGYIYSEPVEQVFWRAPAAGTIIALYLSLWVFLAYKAPGRYDILSEFSATQRQEPFKELSAVIEGKEEVFKLTRGADGRWQYRRSNRPMPSRPEKIIVTENSQQTTFVPDRDTVGHFKVEPGRGLRYRDERGRWMEEGFYGQIETFRPSWLFANLLLNFMHLVVWFVCLWLILQFQWPHALGQAIGFWLVTMLFVVPPLLARAEAAANASGVRAAASSAQSLSPGASNLRCAAQAGRGKSGKTT